MSVSHLEKARRYKNNSNVISLPCSAGVVTDRGLPAAAADAGGGRAAPVEGAGAEM